MISALGQWSLTCALVLACLQALLGLVGGKKSMAKWSIWVQPIAMAQILAVSGAFVCLLLLFFLNDFSVKYVAAHSNSLLPWYYRLAATWGGHEGSLLLWVLLLSGWSFAVCYSNAAKESDLKQVALGGLGALSAGFLLFQIVTSNPFIRLFPAVVDGQDLNPLLQDPGLIFHPPLLYMGYVGFSVAFSYALAGLIYPSVNLDWGRVVRPWVIAAWSFLTLGILLGSVWAYYELGWGGWWFWDPVENASLMPWLTGTALMHMLILAERRPEFQRWAVLLSIVTFALSLLGTFLVRSGVLTSVHAFAVDPARGAFILLLMAAFVGVALWLFLLRSEGNDPVISPLPWISKPVALLAGTVLLLVSCATVLLGTLYPLLMDVFQLGKISVGAPYFSAVFVPVMLPVVLFAGISPFLNWSETSVKGLVWQLRWPVLVCLGIAVAMLWQKGSVSIGYIVGVTLAVWLLSIVLIDMLLHGCRHVRQASALSLLKPAFWLKRWFAMHVAHAGLAIFVLSVSILGQFSEEKTVVLAPGHAVGIAGHTLVFKSLRMQKGPNFFAWVGEFVGRDDPRMTLSPEKRVYMVSKMPMTESAIDVGLWRDVYVALGEPVQRDHPEGAWIVRLYFKPMMLWLWCGVALMGVGGMISVAERLVRKADVV